MRVEKPRFCEELGNTVKCEDCPWADEDGVTLLEEGCDSCGFGFMERCPRNMEQYTQACDLAERLIKEGEK
jgi:hypothetical protein